MPVTQAREITPAARLENVHYAIRDLACVADKVVRHGNPNGPEATGEN